MHYPHCSMTTMPSPVGAEEQEPTLAQLRELEARARRVFGVGRSACVISLREHRLRRLGPFMDALADLFVADLRRFPERTTR